MTRKRHLTAQINPATRAAMLDQLAAIADGIIHDRIAQEMAMDVMRARLRPPPKSTYDQVKDSLANIMGGRW